jgi:predicted ribosome-associated RNA-binding protein Tma20
VVNRPVIIIKNKEEKTCIMIDAAIPADKNVSRKEAEKKIKILEFMLQRIWNMKNMIIPEVTGATGIVTNGLK